MDPIHPIVPQAPVIPSVSPPPGTERISPEDRRREQEDKRRRERRAPSTSDKPSPATDGDAYEDEDGFPHVDIVA